jgi:Fur family peroxide stress response transcriptional regulator
MSLATVYKTLSLLKAMGEVREIGFGDGDNRYDAVKPFSHAHLICTQCRSIIDADIVSLEHEDAALAARSGYRITGHRFDFFGICPQCQSTS